MSDYVFMQGTLCARIASFNLYRIEGQGSNTFSSRRRSNLSACYFFFFFYEQDTSQHRIRGALRCVSRNVFLKRISNKVHLFLKKFNANKFQLSKI